MEDLSKTKEEKVQEKRLQNEANFNKELEKLMEKYDIAGLQPMLNPQVRIVHKAEEGEQEEVKEEE